MPRRNFDEDEEDLDRDEVVEDDEDVEMGELDIDASGHVVERKRRRRKDDDEDEPAFGEEFGEGAEEEEDE